MLYGSGTCAVREEDVLRLVCTDMIRMRWMCGASPNAKNSQR